jgi:hypothetical protein
VFEYLGPRTKNPQLPESFKTSGPRKRAGERATGPGMREPHPRTQIYIMNTLMLVDSLVDIQSTRQGLLG